MLPGCLWTQTKTDLVHETPEPLLGKDEERYIRGFNEYIVGYLHVELNLSFEETPLQIHISDNYPKD